MLRPQVQLMVAARLSPTPAQLDGVDDITQEVLLALAKGISHLEQRTVTGLKKFVSGIVTRQVAAWIKGRKRQRGPGGTSFDKTAAGLTGAGPMWQLLSAPGPSPKTAAEQTELIKKVLTALGRLPAAERRIITMATFDQLSTREIAELKGITREAAYMRFKRAVDKLRAELAASGKERGIDDASRQTAETV